MKNDYLPFSSEILDVIAHTAIEYTFRMRYTGDVKPGQFFEVSIPKYGEAPISVSGIGNNTVDLTIRRVGKVTNEVFAHYIGQSLFLRGPYGNGFDAADYRGKNILVITSGTGLSPVRGIVDYFSCNPQERKEMTLLSGFKYETEILFREDLAHWQRNMRVILTVTRGTPSEACRAGRVTNYISDCQMGNPQDTAAIIVGTPEMMRTCAQAVLELGIPEKNIWISQERKMCCGLGKCGHCKIGDTYVCLDGPVFNYTKGKLLID